MGTENLHYPRYPWTLTYAPQMVKTKADLYEKKIKSESAKKNIGLTMLHHLNEKLFKSSGFAFDKTLTILVFFASRKYYCQDDSELQVKKLLSEKALFQASWRHLSAPLYENDLPEVPDGRLNDTLINFGLWYVTVMNMLFSLHTLFR